MFRRKRLEGSAGFRQLKCNDCHKSSKTSAVTLLALRLKRPRFECCPETQLFKQKTLLFILKSFHHSKEKKYIYIHIHIYIFKIHPQVCRVFTQLILHFVAKSKQNCSDIAKKKYLLFSENYINLKADKGIIQLVNKVGCSRKKYIMKCILLLLQSVLPPMWTGASLKARTISKIVVNFYIIACINNCSTKFTL